MPSRCKARVDGEAAVAAAVTAPILDLPDPHLHRTTTILLATTRIRISSKQQQQYSQPYHSSPPNHSSSSNPRDAALAAAAAVAASIGVKRDRDGAPPQSSSYPPPSSVSGPDAADGGPRKRKSRWGDAADKVTIPTAIGANVSAQDLDKYAVQVRLDEIARKLRSGDFIPPDRERSPSPPPTYDAQGRRTNTREVRYRKKLEDERMALVDRQLKLDPNYRAPSDYHAIKRNQRPTEKVYLPVREFPEIKFFGLLVGPRGNTLKTMERESGAKISIRGRGSVKDGKGKGGDEDEEEMHCVVTADDEAAVKKCIKLINQVIETAASTPEGENDHKRNQLRELAALNGTLRDDENQLCKNCGNKGHRAFECPEQRNWTAHIICHRCGGQGHLARDCTQGRAPGGFGAPNAAPAPGTTGNRQFDSEYANLMAELGEPAAVRVRVRVRCGWAVRLRARRWERTAKRSRRGAIRTCGSSLALVCRAAMAVAAVVVAVDGVSAVVTATEASVVDTISTALSRTRDMQQQQQQYAGYDQGGQQASAAAGQEGEQKDYSAEWAAYYAAQAAYADPNAAQAAAAGDAGGVDYTKEWEEYYRMQAAAAAQDGSAAAATPNHSSRP